jgi:hypothetical protein
MKTRLQIILSVLTLVVLTMTGTSYAQEGSTQFESMELEGGTVDREKILLSPGEGDTRHISRTASENPTTGDSITSVNAQPAPKIKTEKQVPTPKPAVEKQSKEEDESILSFNFLYYIIEKYKLQDIIER